MPRTNVEVDTTRLDRILRNLAGNVADNVRVIAFNVEGKAKANIKTMRAIDTGAMVNSVYTKTYRGAAQDGRSTSEAQIGGMVRGLNSKAETVDLPDPANDREAYVGPSVNYAIDVHYGTHSMAGRPYLANAVRDVEDELAAAGRRICTDE